MRGCLFVLVVAATLLAAVAWFGAPPIAALLVRSALDGSGFRAASTSIAVDAAPPPRILLGRADTVTVRGTDVTWGTLRAGAIDLRLADVDLVARTVRTVSGTIDGAEVETAGPDDPSAAPATVTIAIDGPGSEASAVIAASASTVRRLVLAGVRTSFGVTATDARLVEPDRLRVTTPGAEIEGSLVLDGERTVALATPLGSLPLLTLDAALPLRLTSVRVTGDGLRLVGLLDVDALLR